MAVDLNYGVGVEGKNLVLKTLGRVYVKVKDRKYELVFRPEDFQKIVEQYGGNSKDFTGSENLVVINTSLNIENLEYPGDGTLVISKDGHIYFTENNNYTEIPIKFSNDDITLKNLNISGQIVFTGNNTPLVIPNNHLIQNLNADLLDNYQATDFAIKKANQDIDGSWTFNGLQTINQGIVNQYLKDNTGQRIYIDFSNGLIRCNTISANKITTLEQTSKFSTVTGIGQEIWVGTQIGIRTSNYIENLDDIEVNRFQLVDDAYNKYELPDMLNDETNIEITWWYDFFFSTYDVDTQKYTLRDFDDPNVWNTQNALLTGTNYTVDSFQNLIDGLRKDIDLSAFTGNYYYVDINKNIPIFAIVPNMIIKDNLGNIGCVLNRSFNSLTIRMLNVDKPLSGDQLIVIGTLCRQGGIRFSANDPSLSILKNVLDENSSSVYFGNLTKLDKNLSGIGMQLKGTYPTNLVIDNTLVNLKNYKHSSEINIENPHLKWGDDINIFNEDGSGIISKGQIRWSSNTDLIIDNVDIINSNFKSSVVSINKDGSGNIGDKIKFNSTEVNLNIPIGSAGGDLTGEYPNPIIKDGVVTLKKLNDEVTNKIVDMENRIKNLEKLLEK